VAAITIMTCRLHAGILSDAPTSEQR
jgi:hypothetical protein